MVVHKISSSLLDSSSDFKRISALISGRNITPYSLFVISALNGQYEALGQLAVSAQKGFPEKSWDEFSQVHTNILSELVTASHNAHQKLLEVLLELHDLLFGISLVKECTARTMDLIVSFGSRLSTLILKALLETHGVDSQILDPSTGIIQAKPASPFPEVNFETTGQAIKEWSKTASGNILITGNSATTSKGVLTTLGINGSDYSASLFAWALTAEAMIIWTDTDGIPRAHPSIIPGSRHITRMSVEEAMEMAFFGSNILHPYTLIPLSQAGIPLSIRNIHKPEEPGTLITPTAPTGQSNITGISSIPDVTLLNIEGGGMVGIPGFASRVFSALSQAHVNVIMISQASSEHSICIAIRELEVSSALISLEHELSGELKRGQIRPIEILQPCEIIAVIGENMRGMPGLSGRVFGSAGKAGANILTIAQGSSERNISFAVKKEDAAKTVVSLYKEFFGEEK